MPDEARYALPAPAGWLVLAPALRRRAEHVSTSACEEAVALGLSRWRLGAAALGQLGFDEGWAAGLRYWRDRMIEQHLACVSIETEAAAAAERRRDFVADARRLWGRLTLAARLAGLRGLSSRGPSPWRGAALAEGLREAVVRARPHADALARHGFGAVELAQVAALLSAAAADWAEAERRQRQREAQAQLLVLRGALLGDLALLGQAAAAVLLPQQAQALQRRQLLARR